MTCIDQTWLEQHPEVAVALAESKISHPLDRAHPYPPGSGPAGQTCGTCAKLCRREYSKTYFKCHVLKKFWTAGPATDIRKKDRACMAWEPRIDKFEITVNVDSRVPVPLFGGRNARRLRRKGQCLTTNSNG